MFAGQFPERIAYTVNYTLSDAEARLYKEVTDYVREEFNRAEALENEGRKSTVIAIKLRVDDPESQLKPGMPADVTFK